jgi:hypothetical protein
MIDWAVSTSTLCVRRAWSRSIRNARSSSIPWRSIKIPLARMLRALAETDERNVRLFAGGYRADLADLDLRRDHVVPEAGDELGDLD